MDDHRGSRSKGWAYSTSRLHVAQLARSGKIEAVKTGLKKWSVKVVISTQPGKLVRVKGLHIDSEDNENSGTESDETQLFQSRLYKNHTRILLELTAGLISDIENGNLEPLQKSKVNSKSIFGSFVTVFPSQNKRLWPFLLQHLNNEFNDPPIGKQINTMSVADFWARQLNPNPLEPSIIASVIQRLNLVCKRGSVTGKCGICENYSTQTQ